MTERARRVAQHSRSSTPYQHALAAANTYLVLRVDVRACVQQQLHNLRGSLTGCVQKRCFASLRAEDARLFVLAHDRGGRLKAREGSCTENGDRMVRLANSHPDCTNTTDISAP